MSNLGGLSFAPQVLGAPLARYPAPSSSAAEQQQRALILAPQPLTATEEELQHQRRQQAQPVVRSRLPPSIVASATEASEEQLEAEIRNAIKFLVAELPKIGNHINLVFDVISEAVSQGDFLLIQNIADKSIAVASASTPANVQIEWAKTFVHFIVWEDRVSSRLFLVTGDVAIGGVHVLESVTGSKVCSRCKKVVEKIQFCHIDKLEHPVVEVNAIELFNTVSHIMRLQNARKPSEIDPAEKRLWVRALVTSDKELYTLISAADHKKKVLDYLATASIVK